MKKIFKLFTPTFVVLLLLSACGEDGVDGLNGTPGIDGETVFFATESTIEFLNVDQSVVTVFDSITNILYSTNYGNDRIEIIDISDVSNPIPSIEPIDLSSYGGNIKSIAYFSGHLAIALEDPTHTNNGKVVVFQTTDFDSPYIEEVVGASPKMISFTTNGKYILCANEGKPSDNYLINPKGSISVIDIETKAINTYEFDDFNSEEQTLEDDDFRVYGPASSDGINLDIKADLATDIEPEHITVSEDSFTAYISLQENNGIAKFNINDGVFEEIYPLGTKNFSTSYYDLSNKDNNVGNFQSWPVLNYYQPKQIDFFISNGNEYIVTANEGKIRDYSGFSEKETVNNLTFNLKSPLFDELNITDNNDKAEYIDWLKEQQNLGSLVVTNQNGILDNGNLIHDRIYGFGGRSFSIWTTTGDLVYDSGNELSLRTYNLGSYPDKSSNLMGVKPSSITTFFSGGRNFTAIGLKESGDVLIYDLLDIYNPVFVQRLKNTSPENILFIEADQSPNKKELLIVSNSDTTKSTITIYSK